MNTRLYNARILTMEEGRDIFHGEIWIRDDRIVKLVDADGLAKAQNQEKWDVEYDCQNNLLMPGFKNAHTHSGMTFLRSFADDVPLDKWLNEKIFPMEAKLKEGDVYELVKLAVLEYLSSGITSIFDMYVAPSQTARACIDTGMRCVLTSGLNNFVSSVEKQEEEYIKMNSISPLLSYQMGFHAEYTTNETILRDLAALSHKYKAPVYAHLQETEAEVEGCRKRYGLPTLQFLDSIGMFDYGGGGYHFVHMQEADYDILKSRGMYVVTNPASNLKLASGVAPIAEFCKRDIPVAIGTDGPASNNCLDMFREMYLVATLSKVRENDAACMDATNVLKMATSVGAKAMHIDADVLSEGKLADIILIDLNQPNMQPELNIPKNIVYSGNKTNIRMTMIGGIIRYDRGEYFVGENISSIYEKCQNIADRILQ